jgi:hypothetical protein
LDWYERAVAAIHVMVEKIQIACTSEDLKEPAKKLKEQWRDVQLAHRSIDRVAQEAPLYATNSALAEVTKIQEQVQKVANHTEAFDPAKFPAKSNKHKLLVEISGLAEFLEKSWPLLLREGRRHLGIERGSFWQ